MKKAKQKPTKTELSTPWGTNQNINVMRSKNFDETKWFISERSKVHETYIREEAKTKRIAMVIALILILGACAMLVFSPQERRVFSYFISGVLLVFAGGAVGYKRVWGKTKWVSLGADQDKRPISE